MDGTPARFALLGLLLCLLGCGQESSNESGSRDAGGSPATDIHIPLSGTDPAHVVGASSFNRFHLRTLGDGTQPFPASDLWGRVDALLAAGETGNARTLAAASEEADRAALRKYAALAPQVSEGARAALRAAGLELAKGAFAAAKARLEAAVPPSATLLAVEMAEAGGRAALGLGLHRSADQRFRTAALAARAIGWVRGEQRALQQAFTCQARLGEHVAMLDTLKRILVLQQVHRDLLAPVRTRVDLGCVYALLSNYARALDHLDEGARGYLALGHRRARAHAFACMGLVYLRRAEYSPALDALDKAQSLLQDTAAAKPRAYVLGLLGNVYENMGDLDRALALYRSAQKLHGKDVDVDVGDVLGNLGSVHFHLERYDDAEDHFERARAIFEKLGDREGMGNALFSLGRVKKLQGGYRTALEIYAQALALQDEGSSEAARTRCAIAETHLAMGKPEEAFRELDAVMAIMDDSSDRVVRVELLVVYALAHLRSKQPQQAVEKIRRSLDLMMEVTAGLADEHVVGVRERRSWVFDTGMAVALRIGRVDLATEFLEHGRAGALLEGLGGGARSAISPALAEAQARAAHALADANRRYQQARAQRKLKALREADAAVKAARAAYRTVQQRIQREAKRVASVFHPVPDALAALRRQLTQGDVLVLYAVLPFQAYALIITPRDERVVWLGNTQDIRRACEALQVDTTDEALRTTDAVEARVDALRKQVIDALHVPAGTRRLLLSPDGPLCYVPYPFMLRDSDMQVVCLPSGTTLRLLAEERARSGKGMLAVGDPDYTIEHQGHSLQVYADGVPLEPLPATRAEVLSITTEDDARLLGAEATVAQLAATAATRERWRVIHLACHGLIDPRTPTLSALALTPSAESDGFLTALEVYGMNLPADLVVLSGCNTGRGRFTKGEGLVGLMRAFMCAGAPRIIVSLWKVDDAATQALMTRFHALWGQEGVSTAQALARAQAEIRKDERWGHPRYWGAWVLWGLPD